MKCDKCKRPVEYPMYCTSCSEYVCTNCDVPEERKDHEEDGVYTMCKECEAHFANENTKDAKAENARNNYDIEVRGK